MTPLFDKSLDFILRPSVEGGFADDPDDPGGATNYGISLRFYQSDIDPAATIETIRTLKPGQAAEIYRTHFWNMPRCNAMPEAIAFLAFDGCVNQGRGKTIRLLQKALGMPAQYIDGVYGPRTSAALHTLYTIDLVNSFAARRAQAYAETVNFHKYGLGWMQRLMAAHAYAVDLFYNFSPPSVNPKES